MLSCEGLEFEIIVVDNQSSDGSDAYLRSIESTQSQIILNDQNIGYGKAMNQGIESAKGTYILLLNPDAILTKESIAKSLEILRKNNECGAVGVRMMDGNGAFLKESKRGYPTLSASFYKITGISNLFPESEVFAQYHLGHLKETNNYEVEVLTGAYLMSRTDLIKELGGFDPRYFMYGEDIDLSVAITSAGYYNYYLGETSIIHFKGESTKRDSVQSTYHFYNSMLLFVKKYHSSNWLYLGLLSIAISMAGLFAWIKNNLLSKLKVILRSGIYLVLFYQVSRVWGNYNFGNSDYLEYTNHYILIVVYAGIIALGYYMAKTKNGLIKNLLLAIGTILIFYSLLPLAWRTSRAVIVLGGLSIILVEVLWAIRESLKVFNTWRFWNVRRKGILLGRYQECKGLLSQLRLENAIDYAGIIGYEIVDQDDSLSNFEHLEGYLMKNDIDIMTMHMESLSMEQIMTTISKFGSSYQYLLYSQETNTIIDSPDSQSQGTVSLVEISWGIDKSENKLLKRITDIGLSICFLFLTPILIWFIKKWNGWFVNIFNSLIGKVTWVGYNPKDKGLHALPRLKPSVVSISHNFATAHSDNVAYARDYTFMRDIMMIFNRFASLGDKVELHGKN